MMYVLLVRVFGAHKRKWLVVYTVIGWGEPACVGMRYEICCRNLHSSTPEHSDLKYACGLYIVIICYTLTQHTY